MSLPTSGRPLVSQELDKTTTTAFSSIGDPEIKQPGSPDWRLQCPVVWKRISFVGDGATRDYAVGSYYVTGFLRVFVNGIRQKPTTHFTETDVEAGTLNLVQAPRTNDNVEIEWAEYCDSNMAPALPPGTGGTPIIYKPPSSFGTGPGKRVYVVGQAGTASKFGWTENIFAASPTWTANNTGLPTAGANQWRLLLDPYAPSSRGFMYYSEAGATSLQSLWRNTAMRTGGAWTEVLTYAGVKTATGDAGITGISIVSADMSTAQVGIIYALVTTDGGASGNQCYLLHSHDYGATWTALAFPAGNFNDGPEQSNRVTVGQHDAQRAWVFVDGTAFSATRLTTDGGHTFSTPTQNASGPMRVQYRSATADDSVLFCNQGTNFVKSTNFGDTWSTVSTSPDGRTNFRVADVGSTLIVINGAGAATSSLNISTDGGATWTARDTGVTRITAGNGVDGNIALLRNVSLIRVGATPYVAVSTDMATFTSKGGNVATVLNDGANLPVLSNVGIDWTT